jgi:hypothetical protein
MYYDSSRRSQTGAARGSTPSDAFWFAQALLGNDTSRTVEALGQSELERSRLEWLARISAEHEHQLRCLL